MGISRDEICAQRIGQIAEMGCMEEEIIVFGCCYLEDGKVKYRVSSDKDEIYRFLLKASDDKLFPTPVQELTVRQIIPTDGKDEVLYQVKRKLAQKLKMLYPAEYFAQMRPFVEQEAGNAAWPLLEQLREDMEGLFEADELHFYEMLCGSAARKNCWTTNTSSRHGIGWRKIAIRWKMILSSKKRMRERFTVFCI